MVDVSEMLLHIGKRRRVPEPLKGFAGHAMPKLQDTELGAMSTDTRGLY